MNDICPFPHAHVEILARHKAINDAIMIVGSARPKAIFAMIGEAELSAGDATCGPA